MKKIKIKKPHLIVALISMMVCALIGGAYGYYIHNKTDDGVVVASNFFFESDYLSEEGKTYTLNVNANKITFKLKNYADELRCSENDVNYVITVNAGTLSQSEGTLLKGSRNYHEITLSNLEEGKTYNVIVTGESGYTRTLKATFIVRNDDIEFYKNIDTSHNNYVTLTVWTENISGEATIIFPQGVIPDNTCEGMRNVLTSSYRFEIDVEEYSSYVFRFFKTDGFDVNKEFSVYLNINGTNVEAVTQKIN